MMAPCWPPPLHDRIARLAETFHQLKDRVRDAVASEMGKVVADAVRDWITAALHGRMPTRYPAHGPEYAAPRDSDGWDDADRWRDDDPPCEVPAGNVPPVPKVSTWAAALSVGVVAAKWLIVRRLPVAPALGVGVVFAAFALVGGPVVHASLAAASAAADLVAVTGAGPRPAR